MAPEPEVLLEHAPWLRKLAWSLARDSAEADDLEQEMWTAAFHGGPDDPGAIKGWFRSVGQRVTAMQRRGDARRRAREQAVARPDLECDDPHHLAARRDLFRTLMDRVDALPQEMREAIHLRYFEGLGPHQIAGQLGAPVATVKTRLRRGLERLRTDLDATYGRRDAWAPVALWGLGDLGTGAASGGAAAATTSTKTVNLLIATMTAKTLFTSLATLVVLAFCTLWITGAFGEEPSNAADVTQFVVEREPEDSSPESTAQRPEADAPAREPVALDVQPKPAAGLPPGLGQVVDEKGAPIPGVQIRVSEVHNMDGPRWPQDATLTTDDGGRFPLPEPPLTAYRLLHPDFIPAARFQGRNPEGPTVLKMLSLIEVPLEVTVRDLSTGELVPRFELTAKSLWEGEDGLEQPTITQHSSPEDQDCRDGRFVGTARFIAGGSHEVRVMCIGMDPGTLLGETQRGKILQATRKAARVRVEPKEGEPIRLEIEMDLGRVEQIAPHGTLEGSVVSALDGQPLGGVEVGIFGTAERGAARAVQTDVRGRFRIARLAPDTTAELRFVHPELQSETVVLEPNQSRLAPVKLWPRGSLTVTVLDGTGSPRPTSACKAFRVDSDDNTFRFQGHTDEHGVLSFQNLLAGTYVVVVLESLSANDDDGGLGLGSFRVEKNAHTEETIALGGADEALEIRGRILSAAGAVLNDRKAMFLPEAPGAPPAIAVMENGSYTATDLQPGSFTIMIAPVDDGDFDTNVVILQGVEIRKAGALDLTLPTGSITGRIQGVDDPTQLRVVAVSKAPEGSMAHSLMTNPGPLSRIVKTPAADGSFTLPEIADGEWVVQVYAGLHREARNAGVRLRVVASREVQVQGTTHLGDWTLP